MSQPILNEDFTDLLQALISEKAKFIIVGAFALAAHGVPRTTGDLDLWIETTPENTDKIWKALLNFGAPTGVLGISKQDLATPNLVVQLGLPPRRIDLLTEISGVSFEEAWPARMLKTIDGLELPFIARDLLIKNKRATGRPKDLLDVSILETQST
jgi:hypothetical protein